MTLEEARHALQHGESCDVSEALSWALSLLEWRPIETLQPTDGAVWILTLDKRGRAAVELAGTVYGCRMFRSHWRPLGPGPEGK